MSSFYIQAAAAFPERYHRGNVARNRRKRNPYPKPSRYEDAADPRGKDRCEVELKTASQWKSRVEYRRTDLYGVICPSLHIPPGVDECSYSGGVDMGPL